MPKWFKKWFSNEEFIKSEYQFHELLKEIASDQLINQLRLLFG